MLPDEQIMEVMRLLREGRHSQRQIAILTDVSRIMIYRIAHGKRKPNSVANNTLWDEDHNKKPFQRCHTCGGFVQLPCIACIVRRLPKPTAFGRDHPEPLVLALEDEHRKRYKKVKEWRERQDDPDFTVIPEEWPFRRKPHFSRATKNENQ